MYRTKPRTRQMAEEERLKDLTVPEDAGRYLRAHKVLTELREKYLKRRITPQQYRTLRGQAIAGDIDVAVKGLAKALRDREMEEIGL